MIKSSVLVFPFFSGPIFLCAYTPMVLDPHHVHMTQLSHVPPTLS